ncbi:hypothetical protein FB567DRAFT_438487 [Paraphoma chrysanthemicola]|uniref:G1/S-specific cyclin pas1 n=1 Tax=Paraphoma chrysanthemicola TaxID=798071 RepID=A0A8K0RA90_9PLEO|nr:hypothetical protein FB567DRAFT_438487 [Paraphoma chrysanthemicola]
MTLDILPQTFGVLPETHPYAAPLSSSASSSTSSVFSDAASQTSSASSTSQHSQWESEEWSVHTRRSQVDLASLAALQPITRVSTYPQYQPSACRETAQERLPSLRTELLAPVEQRQHPRRSSTTISQRGPPQLVRQCERKVNFVDCLVDSATQMVEVIWQLSEPKSRCETASGRGVLPLRTFIQETLRRSRTSYSTLQVALYYLILIKAHLPKHDFTMSQPEDASLRALQCGRRMFLAALILASKYLQDRNYSARAWSKISGLKVCEINTNEMAFLEAVNWKLHITDPIWEKWQEVVLRHTPTNPPASPGAALPNTWKDVIPSLTPELEVIVLSPKTPVTPVRPTLRQQLSASPLRPSSDPYGSQESTPTPSRYQVPRFLEPKPDLLPPTPSLARLGPLPTPALTPQSYATSTPAAGAMAFGSRRTSMCSAMQQAQCSSLARTCVDQFNPSIKNGLEAYHFPSRRPSLAPSNSSLSSSPESMISDNSRSSRASSISSVSSVGWAPNQSQAKLARLATCRNARLPYPALSKCKEQYEYAPSEPMSSPDLDSFHIDDSDATVDSPSGMAAPSRKRGRSSVDLQQNVRHLLHSTRSAFNLRSHQTILPDRSVAQSFVLSENRRASGSELKGLQSPKHTAPECSRLPVQKDFGKKRTCCGTEAAKAFRPQGPGMWEGIL